MEHLNKPIRIALVDDHILLRDSLAKAISDPEEINVILQASNGQELIDNMQAGIIPDLILLDLSMPVLDGYQTAKWLREHFPAVLILVVSMYDSELTMIRLLKAGVRGFLKKDIRPSELRDAIRSTMKTGYYYSGNAANRLINLIKNDVTKLSKPNALLLSEKELRFLELAGSDMSIKEIAATMNVSPRNINHIRDTLLAKLNVRSRVGLVVYAMKSGLITPD